MAEQDESGKFRWRPVLLWTCGAFLIGLLTVRPPWANYTFTDRVALGVMVGIGYATVGGVVGAFIGYWQGRVGRRPSSVTNPATGDETVSFNKVQIQIAIVAIILFMLMGFCPPWIYTFDHQSVHREKPAGYALIIDPPAPERNAPVEGVRLDLSRLMVQWLVLAVGAIGGILVARKTR